MSEPERTFQGAFRVPTPLVSIVTPCFNASRFITATIESVLTQDYPNIEYIVADGGSTDGTIDILKRYEGRLTWVSESDGGAADAINRGFARSHGEIFTFLNADDLYMPHAVSTAIRSFEGDVVYGDAWWIDEAGERIARYPVQDFDADLLARECFICQPASFLRRKVFENVGGMDPQLGLTFDYELWMRMAKTHTIRRIEGTLASSRMHASNKSLGQRSAVFRETFRILRRHYGYVPFQWIYAYLCHRRDGRDQFFEPFQPSVFRYLESLPKGLIVNRTAMPRYFAEWIRVMSWGGLLRRLGAG
jgi:glycosyltransferase involved in cell wall biosynthesis